MIGIARQWWRLIIACGLAAGLAPWQAAGTSTAAPSQAYSQTGSPIRIAFTQNHNVYLMNADGGGRVAVTTDGTSPQPPYGPDSAIYPWYQWSPDGKYLLLLRRSQTGADLLLVNAQGKLLRVLAQALSGLWGFPTWAVDDDKVMVQQSAGGNALDTQVSLIDVHGTMVPLFHLNITGLPCSGGGWPPTTVMLYQNETWAVGAYVPTISWSSQQNLAAINTDCAKPVLIADLHTGQEQTLSGLAGSWQRGALSRAGLLALTLTTEACSECVGIVDPRVGRLLHSLSEGDFPVWSKSGNTIYFTDITAAAIGTMTGPVADSAPSLTFPASSNTSSIWRADGDGSHLIRLLTIHAYGLGPLQVTPDGRSLIFSSVDNPSNLYHHLLAGNRYDQRMLDLYGPRVSIRMLNLSTGRLTTLVRNAGRPVVQP